MMTTILVVTALTIVIIGATIGLMFKNRKK